jgi:Alw26I/Eco31I/Esp3I family type II restriction m6 adenine DNA methyltransferase
MDKKELQKKLNKPYTTQNWQEVVQFVFPNAQILNPPMVIPIDNDKVELFRQIGNVRLQNGKNLALFELKLKENVNILRNRVELNNIVSQYIDQDQNHGVLSIFEQGKDDYRFTFTARSSEFDDDEGDFKTTKTDTKRFTYVLGKNESCKTPASQFFELSNNKDLKIEDVIKAFNITKLNDDFFNEYKVIYNNIVEFFTGKKLVKVGGKWEEKTTSKPNAQLTYIFNNNELEARNFVKMLLGRIVFLKFVQKKRWMGVPKTRSDWKEGNIRFLEETFENFKHKEVFYSTFLSPLFFDALNNPNRKDDVFTLTDSKIPYLSGGLFDEDNLKTKEIIIPEKHFEDIFEFLDKFNFTIDENSDIDDKNEFSIDPEMLGHIFENLLEDNKDKGAFYTPKEIVRYMCQESLKEYLKTSLENNKQWPTDEMEAAALEKSLHNFVTKKEARGIIDFDVTIARALKEVKICDPAIGSGAFPMGLLNEIFQLMHKLYEANPDKVERIWELDGWQPNLVKQNIIQNSIYGVDIEKGAVDIARLRFWLSLIVDEPEPKALPHLDYKIVVGNSLVSKLDDTIIDIDWNLDETKQGFFGSSLVLERGVILQNINDKQKAVFDPNSDEEKLSLEIRNLKIDLLSKQLELMINNQNIPKEPKIADYQNKPKAKFIQDQAKYFETVGWRKQIKNLQKLKEQTETPLNFFDWKLDFPEVMNEELSKELNREPGFDIVIANPPYDVYEGNKKNEVEGLLSFDIYQKCKGGKLNAFELFLSKTDILLKNNGTNCQIFQNSFLADNSSKGVRIHYLNSQTITFIDSFPERDDIKKRVFETVKMSVCILKSKKKILPDYDFILRVHIDKTLGNYFDTNYKKSEIIAFDSNNYIIPTLKNEDKKIFNRYYKSKKLISYSEKFECIEGELNMTFHKKYMTNDIKKPLIVKGAQIQRYFVTPKPSQGQIEYVDIDNYINDYSKSKKSYHHKQKRIALQGISGANDTIRIISTIIEENIFCANSCNYIIKKNENKVISLETLLGIFNSKLTNWVFRKTSTNSNVNCYEINNLKFPDINKTTNEILNKNVLKIIENKKKSVFTIDHEQQIDNLVYKLYELTYDEVLVVEPEFSERMSAAEYDSLKLE